MATLNGTPGNDTLTGTASADSLFGFAGNDSLLGLGGKDRLEGGGGNDTLDGGIGIDTLIGGAGNDTYIVDTTTDTITEAANSGIDTVQSSVSYTLGINLENLTLTGIGVINGTGNDLNNIIIGNAADNTLNGGNGTDTLYGGDGNDFLYSFYTTPGNYSGDQGDDIIYGGNGDDRLIGGDGNNILNGGAGNDTLDGNFGSDTLIGGAGDDVLNGSSMYGDSQDNTLVGGAGNDTYVIDSRSTKIQEVANGGIDIVETSVSYTLGSNLENLVLGAEQRFGFEDAIDGIGNSLNNTITGNGSENILKGEAGNDTLNGGYGNDDLFGSANGVGEKDILSGNEGRDTFYLGDTTTVFYDDGNPTSAGTGDYALIKDFNTSQDFIKLNGRKTDYFLAQTPVGLPIGTAIYRDKPSTQKDELIAIIQGSSNLKLNSNYFRFTADEINLSQLNGTDGFVIKGINEGDSSGFSVSSAGDINGDGFDDVIIGAPFNGQYDTGESYVVFGKAGGFSPSLNLSALNGSNGFKINGIDASDLSGRSVSSAGDVNSDSFDDLIIGAPTAGEQYNGGGESYVVFGKAGGFSPSLNLSDLNGSNGFKINGIDFDDKSGKSVSSAGDVNGDGFDDLIIGAYRANPNGQYDTGESYVVFGKAGGFSPSLNLSALNGNNGFALNGIDFRGFSGSSVSTAGDVNSDGFDDLIIKASGESYVLFGKAGDFSSSFNLSTLNGSNGFKLNGGDDSFATSATSVSVAGDVNGDGFDDLIIGGYSHAGESYVVFGKAGGFSPSLYLSDLNGSNGFVIKGNNYEFSGYSVSGAGDVNGDGFDDILIGVRGANPNGQSSAGESYVVFGKEGGFDASLDLFDINGHNGFVINGIDAGDLSGNSVSDAGDVNGDGFDDLMVGAGAYSFSGQNVAGESYVIFGRDFINSVTQTGTAGNDTLTGTAGDDVLIGGLGNDRLIGGISVDVLIGGAGNDIITFGATDRRSNGGSGIDTLRIDGSDSINLTTIANNKFTAFEIIDITGTGNNSLAFTRLDLLDLSDTTNRLIVNGNAGDKVTSTAQGWTFGGTTTVDNILYRQYTTGAATLLVDADITQTIT